MLSAFKTKESFIVTCFLTFDKCLKDLQQLKFKAKEVLASLYNCISQQKILSKKVNQHQNATNNKLVWEAYNRALIQALKCQSQFLNTVQDIVFDEMKRNADNMAKIYKNLNLIDNIIVKQQSDVILRDYNSKQCRYYIFFIELYELVRIITDQYRNHIQFLQRQWKQINIIFFGNEKYENIEKINRYLLHASFQSCISRVWIEEWHKLLPLLQQKRLLI